MLTIMYKYRYSTNEGRTWHSYRFSQDGTMYVYGVLNEPGERTTIFFLFGASPYVQHSWITVKVDFMDVFRECIIIANTT